MNSFDLDEMERFARLRLLAFIESITNQHKSEMAFASRRHRILSSNLCPEVIGDVRVRVSSLCEDTVMAKWRDDSREPFIIGSHVSPRFQFVVLKSRPSGPHSFFVDPTLIFKDDE